MEITDLIHKWQSKLELENWTIILKAIDRSQVTFDDDVPEKDKYFVGIVPNRTAKTSLLIHDRELNEEDIVHELLHIKLPSCTENQINLLTDLILK